MSARLERPAGDPARGDRPVTAAVVLAAGRATRFGSTKQLAEVAGKPLVQHAVDAAAGAGCDEIVVVLGHDRDAVAAALRLPANARLVRNADFAEGQSTSLRAGLRALGEGSGAAVILLADQPGVTSAEVRAVIAAHDGSPASIVRARYRGTPGHPVLLERSHWPEAMEGGGDEGARSLLERRAGEVRMVDLDRDPPPDVDVPADVPPHEA